MAIFDSIFSIIFGIFLILAWLPTIFATENNNKNNNIEFNDLKNNINNVIKLTKIDLTFNNNLSDLKYSLPNNKQFIVNENVLINGNFYITLHKEISDSRGRSTSTNKSIVDISIPLIKGIPMNKDDYINLALQNNVQSEVFIDGNITYIYKVYCINKNKNVYEVSGLQEKAKEFDIIVNNYEMGNNEDEVITNIINRKKASNTLQKWLGRIGTFLMLFGGLSLLVSPLRMMQNNLFFGPVRLLLDLYQSLSFLGSLLLSVLMTFLVWSIINKPIISVLIVGIIVGISMYLHKKN